MPLKRPRLLSILGLIMVWGMSLANAAGLGDGSAGAVLGQTLDFSVQLRSDGGEALTAECLSAEVTAGERRLPPGSVRTALQVTGPGSARVRITTAQAIDEPVIGIVLNVGCQARITRR